VRVCVGVRGQHIATSRTYNKHGFTLRPIHVPIPWLIKEDGLLVTMCARRRTA
jgi:hypothetical protein